MVQKKLIFIIFITVLTVLLAVPFVYADDTEPVIYGDHDFLDDLEVIYNDPSLFFGENRVTVINSVSDIWVDETGDTMTGDLTIGTTFYTDIANGRVGIGTASPTRKLQVRGGYIDAELGWNSGFSINTKKVMVQSGNNFIMGWVNQGTYFTSFDAGPGTDYVSLFVAGTNKFHIDADGNVGIGTATPSYPLEVMGNGTANVSIWAFANISATGYITRTSVFDSSKDVWDYIKDSDYYLTDGKIDHKKFYGYAGEFIITDYSRPVEEEYIEEVCEEDEKFEMICINQTKIRITYPYTKTEKGISLDAEVNLLRQAVYELNERVKYLEENCITK